MMRLFVAALCVGVAASASAQRDFSQVEIQSTDLGNNIHMLTGAGGNMALSVGDDGAFLVDDQFAPLTGKILAKIAELTDQPVKFVINTHWHGDHTGGNENLGNDGAIIIAHDNVRKRMAAGQFMEAFNREVAPAPQAALPVITFNDQVALHHNGEHIHAYYAANAHTDGDALIHFQNANVLHMGDTFFNGLYPFIDVQSGGSINGVINAAEQGLAVADDNTKIIPGHGQLTDRAGLQAYRDMLIEIRDNVQTLKNDGQSLEQIIAAKPGASFDDSLGGAFIKPEQLVAFIYNSL